MRIALVQYTSDEIRKEADFLTFLSDSLESNFKNKNYGVDINELIIGVICVSKNFEPFFIPQKPKYIKEKKIKKSKYTGLEYEVEKCLTYDIKLDFNEFKNAENDTERKKILAKSIFDSLIIFDEMKKKIKDFNIELFKSDLMAFFCNVSN